MATRPLPEAAAGPQSARYVEELREFFFTCRVPFGSTADLEPMVARVREPGAFSDDLSSLLRSFILREGGAMPHSQLLEVLTLAIAGREPIDSPQQYSEPLRQLLSFVAGVLRRPWNVPPGQRPDVLPFPDAAAPVSEPKLQSSSALDPIAAATRPAPVTPTPEPPLPIPPPQDIPEPSPPPSALAAALVELPRMASRPEPAPRGESTGIASLLERERLAELARVSPQPEREPVAELPRVPPQLKREPLAELPRMSVRAEPEPRAESRRMALRRESAPQPNHSEPVLFLRAADVPRPEPEPDLDPTFDTGLDRPSPVFRSVLVVAALGAALALFFYYSGRKPADIFRVHPLAAFARLESFVHRPSASQSGSEQQPANPSLTIPNTPPTSVQPAPPPPTNTATQPGRPAPRTDSSAEPVQPPSHSAYVKPLHHPEAATTSTYATEPLPKPTVPQPPEKKATAPEPTPPIPAPAVAAPVVVSHPVPVARPQPAASTATPPSNPNQYTPYRPSTADETYAPYHPNGTADRSPQQTHPATPPSDLPVQPPTQSSPQTEPHSEIQSSAPTVSELPRGLASDGIGLGMVPGGPPHRPLSEPSKEIEPSFYSVSSHVMEANLISSPGPDYPPYARATHVQGQVTMEAVIDKQGTVTSIRILTGHHLLREAAEDAVRRWRYRPYVVNGQPVEVATIVTVDFHNPA